MTRTRARARTATAALAACVAALAGDPAAAATAGAHSLDGGSIAIRGSCAARITVLPDPARTGSVSIDAEAAHPEELARLAISNAGGSGPAVDGGHTPCWRPPGDGSFAPTLTLSVTVPPGAPVSLAAGGRPEVRIGATRGPLELALAGDAHVEAAAMGPVRLEAGGAPIVSITAIEGPATFTLAGAGKVIVAHIASDHVVVAMEGDGLLALGPGSIRDASLTVTGGGTIGIRSTVGDAEANVTGSGHVDIGRMSGRLQRVVTGSGSVSVGD